MGLNGSLRDFGISAILQLISGQRRTGRLEVKSDQGEYHILISEGKIVQIEKKPAARGESLSDYLVRAGAVPLNQARLAEQKSKSELKPLEAVLAGLELISALDLKTYIFTRNMDLINQLFLLKEGEYEFEAEPVNYHPSYVVEIDTEQVLMDGYRIKDEWARLLKEIGPMEGVFRKRGGEFGTEDRLKDDQARIYQWVDGRKTIAEIASLTMLTRFEAMKILADLKRIGRIEPEMVVEEKGAAGKSISGLVYQSAFWVLIALLLGLSANGIRIYLSGPEKASITGPARTWQEERIRQGLEIYRLEQGSYPQTLSELSRKGILPESDLKFGQKRQYYYEEGGYQISGPRP